MRIFDIFFLFLLLVLCINKEKETERSMGRRLFSNTYFQSNSLGPPADFN